jgi:hypothetical protein
MRLQKTEEMIRNKDSCAERMTCLPSSQQLVKVWCRSASLSFKAWMEELLCKETEI